MSRYMYICIRYCEVFGYLHLLAWGKWDGGRATNRRIVWRVSVQVRSIPLFPSCIRTFLLILNVASAVPFFIWMLLLWITRWAAWSGWSACRFAHSVVEGWTHAAAVRVCAYCVQICRGLPLCFQRSDIITLAVHWGAAFPTGGTSASAN